MLWYEVENSSKTNNNTHFSDIDECALNVTVCEQVCINSDGSFTCACNEGYQLIVGTNQCEGT